MTTDNFCFYLQNRLIQTIKIGGQQYSDINPFSIPCLFLSRLCARKQDFQYTLMLTQPSFKKQEAT